MKKLILFITLLLPAFIVVPLHGQKPLAFRDPAVKGPQTFAMVIGISKYRFIRPLTYADKDADLFRDFLKSPGGGHLKDPDIFMLTNDDATSGNFWSKGFQWLAAKQLQKNDRLFIYLAGHGDAIDEDQFFFLGYDCNPNGDKNNYLVGGAIQLYNLKKKIANETAKGVEVFFVMDACRSNELPGGSAGQNFLNTAVSQKKAGEMMMLATEAGQESLEDASIGNGHGLFTYYLVDGLCGLADAGTLDGKITFSELKSYVDKNVPPIAQQRFNRSQVPYFCCDENSEKVISQVDAAYLQKWIKGKRPGGGNSFNGVLFNNRAEPVADTLLIETYNKFYREIRNKNFSGSSSAESYFLQLDKKFPGNPYTLDAKSTLAAEYINDAQRRVNDYLSCITLSATKERMESAAAGARLEKAMEMIREYVPDFSNALVGRMYLLKSMGDFGNTMDAFNFAYAARSLDPNEAYINNWLARLHLANSRSDSALFYANKAAKQAPNWPCVITTLALAQQAANKTGNNGNNPPAKKPLPKSGIGFTLGGGLNSSDPAFQLNPNTNIIGADSKSSATFDIGIIFHVPIGKNIAIRPAAEVLFGSTEISFQRRNATGGGVTTEVIPVNKTSVNISLPLVIHFSDKKISPYLQLGPSFSLNLDQNNSTSDLLPIKKSLVLADAGLGLDFRIPKTGMVISPELKFSLGLSDMKDKASTTAYSSSLSSLKKQAFTLNVYLRSR